MTYFRAHRVQFLLGHYYYVLFDSNQYFMNVHSS